MTRLHAQRILLLVETSFAYGRRIIEGISQFALEHPEWILQILPRGLHEQLPSWLKRWHGQGIISRSFSPDFERMIQKLGVPFVELLGNDTLEVRPDETKISQMAVEHFRERGLRFLAYFGLGSDGWSVLRGQQFAHYASQSGLGVQFFCSREKMYSFHSLWNYSLDQEIGEWLESLSKPTGLLCATSDLAIALSEICRDIGIRVPEDICLLGASEEPDLCNIVHPQISGIDTNDAQIGYQAAALLYRRIHGLPIRETLPIQIPPLYVVTRQSTDLIACEDMDVVHAIRLIRERAAFHITVNEVAETLNLSRSTLYRKFRKLLGRSPNQEISSVQMTYAKTLLQETNLSIAEVSIQAGFSSSEYFMRAFRRMCGMTPSVYRKNAGYVVR